MVNYSYKIFGLKFWSQIELPEIAQDYFLNFDVEIKLGKNPIHIPIALKKGVLFEASPNDFLFRFISVGSYRVQNGNLITVDLNSDATLSETRLFLYGSIMGALLHQRRIIPIHGSSVVINEKAISFIGKSSSGKSTLAAGFANDGFPILSDDLTALTIENNQTFKVHPGMPYIKLWEDVLKSINFTDSLKKVRPTLNKYFKPLDQSYCKDSIQLSMFVYLEPSNCADITHELIVGSEKFNLIRSATYRYQFLNGENNIQNYFISITNLSKIIPLYRIRRPESPLRIIELIEYLKKNIFIE